MGNVNLRKLEAEGGKPGKRGKAKHGVYAYLAGNLPSGRSWKKTQREVSRIREALIEQYGGEKIQPAVLALIESAIEGLMIQRLSGLYVKKAGIMRVDSLAKGNLELHSILSGQWISYGNLVRLNLEAAARLAQQKAPEGPVPTIAEIIREHDAAEAEAQAARGEAAQGSAAVGPGIAQEGRSAAGQDDGKDEDDADPGGDRQGSGKRASKLDGDGRSAEGEAEDQAIGEGGPEGETS